MRGKIIRIQRKNQGFTLIELMVAVAIVAILVALSLPQFLRFSAKARRSEGVTLIKGIFTSEIAYYGTYDSYAFDDVNFTIPTKLGFSPSGTTKHYNFSTAPVSGMSPAYVVGTRQTVTPFAVTDFYIFATGNIDGDPQYDELCAQTYDWGQPACALIGGVVQVFNDDVIN